RLELGLNQRELSEKLNIQRTTITNYENGNITPTAEKLPEIANILNTSVDYLLGRSDYINKADMVTQIRRATKDGIHDIEILISDLKEQIALDNKLTYKDELVSDKNKDLIIDQLDLIMKIISL
ncbi:MAG: helix-turn-helix transcriptional regulator, partial [Peptoniphilus grossensis]|uniref:helix-turn-helix domain-containing protein n=1 Tax=Peptoniphilus grossensis TaxID=1465756 RepID=UPI00290BC7F6